MMYAVENSTVKCAHGRTRCHYTSMICRTYATLGFLRLFYGLIAGALRARRYTIALTIRAPASLSSVTSCDCALLPAGVMHCSGEDFRCRDGRLRSIVCGAGPQPSMTDV